ncbi:hypothetical protein EYF80_051579 [Liparis tanakae]|uniref:Uncharacterized protein n=1 Tax=Liparis tanakae TaxID=230148 RepID=A0A4Z2FAI2_9TELE|nr:hypothetical protein EYF80_051579 [Liparis tanakae]
MVGAGLSDAGACRVVVVVGVVVVLVVVAAVVVVVVVVVVGTAVVVGSYSHLYSALKRTADLIRSNLSRGKVCSPHGPMCCLPDVKSVRQHTDTVPANSLTSSVLILRGLGSLVVCDAPHHAGLVASPLGSGCRVVHLRHHFVDVGVDLHQVHAVEGSLQEVHHGLELLTP